MRTVLVVDDVPIVREPIAASLRAAGYQTLCAGDGREALALASAQVPDLILLDINMPVMDGFEFLKAMRGTQSTAHIPVMLLSGEGDREHVRQAAAFGVRGYVLKSRFSLPDLLQRIEKALESATPAAPVAPAGTDQPTRPGRADAAIGSILTREQSLERAHAAAETRTLGGVVAQVIAMASSPRGDAAQLASIISRDAVLSARVLRAANSAAYAGARARLTVATIPDAIRQIGSSAVRNIASAVGVFGALPRPRPDVFNPFRAWQHSFAVAMLCEQLTLASEPQSSGTAYVVGLCHDLGEILFQSAFDSEYRQVREARARTGSAVDDVERAMLGITRAELVRTITAQLGLPDTIRIPIERYHQSLERPSETQAASRRDKLSAVLAVADCCANGMLLAASGASEITPLTRAQCRAASGREEPALPDAEELRGEIMALTVLLARLSPEEEAAMLAPLYARTEKRLWLAQPRALPSFNPITLALRSLAHVQSGDQLPTAAQLQELDGIVMISARGSATQQEFPSPRAAAKLPVLHLHPAGASEPFPPAITHCPYPVALERLAHFVAGL